METMVRQRYERSYLLALLFLSTRAHFAERVRQFYGDRLRGDVDEIAFQLMKLELAQRT
jgi:hypothetical protein